MENEDPLKMRVETIKIEGERKLYSFTFEEPAPDEGEAEGEAVS